MRKALVIALLLTAGCSTGPNKDDSADEDSGEYEESETEAPSTNVIKEYVNTPKQAARNVAGKVESQQNKAAEQAKKLKDE